MIRASHRRHAGLPPARIGKGWTPTAFLSVLTLFAGCATTDLHASRGPQPPPLAPLCTVNVVAPDVARFVCGDAHAIACTSLVQGGIVWTIARSSSYTQAEVNLVAHGCCHAHAMAAKKPDTCHVGNDGKEATP